MSNAQDSNGSVEISIAEQVAWITFGHPKANSMPGQLLRKIADEITAQAANNQVKIIVLQSRGEQAFCSGASFDELLAVKNLEESKYFFSGFAILIQAMRACPKFIIARVQGKATGGAVGIIASADYALASEQAAIRLSELAIGLGPFIIGPAVERKLGLSAFNELAVSADWRSAKWAQDHGLYNNLYPNIAELDTGCLEFAKRLSSYNLESMQALKTVLWQGTENWGKLLEERVQITGKLALSEFVQKTVAGLKK